MRVVKAPVLLIWLAKFAARLTNGGFFDCAAAPDFLRMRQNPRCERTERKNQTHRMGS